MKLIRVFLVVSFAVVFTPLHEFAKIPLLISHFHEHNTMNPEIDFSEFIVEHYGNPENLPEHKKLPLQTVNITFFPAYHFQLPIELKANEFIVENCFPAELSKKISPGIAVRIFQPPKTA